MTAFRPLEVGLVDCLRYADACRDGRPNIAAVFDALAEQAWARIPSMDPPLVTGTAVDCGHTQCAEVFDQDADEQGDLAKGLRFALLGAVVFWVGIGWVAVSVVRGWGR